MWILSLISLWFFFLTFHWTEPSSGTPNQVDLFGQNLIGDLLDAPIPVASEKPATQNDPSEVDLFADATFVSAASAIEAGGSANAKVSHHLYLEEK